MCIVFYTLSHPGYKLILAANRDEYLDRPALPAAWHTFGPVDQDPGHDGGEGATGAEPWVLCGRDLGSPMGGTWLGMTRDLRVGVLTNIRHPINPTPLPNPPSRGQLLKSFLSPAPSASLPSVHEYLQGHKAEAGSYEGFNLLLFDVQGPNPAISYLSNRPGPTLLDLSDHTDCKGLSNSPFNDPWPKVTDGEGRMESSLKEWTANREGKDQLVDRMMELLSPSIPLESLADTTRCTCLQPLRLGKDSEVPTAEGDAGTRWYGTRLSTVILVRDDGETTFVERDIGVLDGEGGARKGDGERRFVFTATGR